MSDARQLLGALLRQRRELGEADLISETLDRAELLALLSGAGARRVPEPPRAAAAPAPPPARDCEEPARAHPDASQIVTISTLDELRDVALGCPRCRLAESRTQVVFGEGDPNASVVVVGEAPGAEEDRTGRPFVGRAGKLLDRLLASIGFEREQVYICNVLKCRPPGNRNPEADEIAACSPYLRRQLDLVGPRAILAVGTFPAQTLLGTSTSIGRLRGDVHDFQGLPLVATYHPAALLRNPSWVRPVWEDLQRLRRIVDGLEPA